ncbi:hypothetical protein FJV83_31470 [Mesorhizobium sp. WSM4307]|uniref:SHOCT domain-containing protein n=1 Tax=unclassified Mesorhizobium TaxID=325217 RepID=UPI00115C9546|nr:MULTISPECIES: SHOCT domain-containing protein [unclassified Mesorhizobium]TRC72045.1 hypothetical protein FJV81_30430 [Mesorhizobium sp. WSM4315]TRC77821.1 hypothetical protein FJV83_31470 [Mesorhizobium sp. WSM4307]
MPNALKEAVAELAAMKARGEIDQNEFDRARRILAEKHVISQQQNPRTTRPIPPKNVPGSTGSMLGGLITLGAVISFAIAFGVYLQIGEGKNNGYQRPEAMDGVQTLLKVGGATFFLSVTKELSDPMMYERIAKRICKERSPYGVDGCTVAIWNDDRKMGKDLPMSVEQARSQLYSWSLGRSLWNCNRFPEVGRDKCFSD